MRHDALQELSRRLSAVERQLKWANKALLATVEVVEDPDSPGNVDSRGRIRVSCPDVYGDTGLSPWLSCRSEVNGPGFGTLFTPKEGSQVYISLRDGNPDAGEYFGGPRTDDSTVPDEFRKVNVNGFKTESGIIVKYDDDTGDYSFETGESKMVMHSDGTFHFYGAKGFVHCPLDTNADSAQYGVVTAGPAHVCPLFGPHRGSVNVRASE